MTDRRPVHGGRPVWATDEPWQLVDECRIDTVRDTYLSVERWRQGDLLWVALGGELNGDTARAAATRIRADSPPRVIISAIGLTSVNRTGAAVLRVDWYELARRRIRVRLLDWPRPFARLLIGPGEAVDVVVGQR